MSLSWVEECKAFGDAYERYLNDNHPGLLQEFKGSIKLISEANCRIEFNLAKLLKEDIGNNEKVRRFTDLIFITENFCKSHYKGFYRRDDCISIISR